MENLIEELEKLNTEEAECWSSWKRTNSIEYLVNITKITAKKQEILGTIRPDVRS